MLSTKNCELGGVAFSIMESTRESSCAGNFATAERKHLEILAKLKEREAAEESERKKDRLKACAKKLKFQSELEQEMLQLVLEREERRREQNVLRANLDVLSGDLRLNELPSQRK